MITHCVVTSFNLAGRYKELKLKIWTFFCALPEADHSPPSSADRGQECVELYFHFLIRLHGVVLT